MSPRVRALSAVAALVAASLAAACSDTPVATSSTPPPPPPTRAGVAAADAGAAPPVTLKVEYTENDFTETDRSRDPFRNYAATFVGEGKKQTVNQRQVVLSQYSVDELKLVAIVTGGEYPRAMLVDPQGKGWVLRRGDYVGKPEVVHVGGPSGGDYQLNWRIDKVRDGDLVLLREDPAQPAVPPATRVILLHPEGDPKDKL